MPTTRAVKHRHRQAENMIQEILLNKQEVSAELHRIGAPMYDAMGGVPIDFDAYQQQQAFYLAYYFNRLDRAEEAYQVHKDNVHPLRDRRDALTRALYEKVVAVRGVVERLYSRKAAELVTGLEGKTPRDPHELALSSIFLLNRFRSIDLSKLPGPSVSSIPIDLPKIADELEPLVLELNDVLGELQNHSGRADNLMNARDEAQADFDRMRTSVAGTVESLYRAVRLPELIPGLRNRHYSVRDAMKRKRKTPMPTPDVPEGWRPRELGSHPVQTQSLVDSRPEERKNVAPAPSKPGSHPVRPQHSMVLYRKGGAILPFRDPKSGSHPVRGCSSMDGFNEGGGKAEDDGLGWARSPLDAVGRAADLTRKPPCVPHAVPARSVQPRTS